MNELSMPEPQACADSAALAALLGSRLCHDLISPLGAIGNGVELLTLTGEWPGLANSPELALITESVEAARARIRLFRMAFGAASGDQRLSQSEFVAVLKDAETGGRLKFLLEAPGDHARIRVKMVILGLMCLETALPWGGQVRILHNAGQWHLSGEATRIRQDPALWSCLTPAAPGRDMSSHPTAAEVQFPLLAAEAVRQNRALHWDIGDSHADIRF